MSSQTLKPKGLSAPAHDPSRTGQPPAARAWLARTAPGTANAASEVATMAEHRSHHIITPSSQRLVVVLVACGTVIGLYWESFAGMAAHWAYADYEHGPFVPLASLYLLWRERDLFRQPFRGSWLGLVALLLSVVLWVIGRTVFVQTAEHIALFGILNATVWTMVGDQVYRRLAVPLGFLIFAVPLGDEIIPWLMVTTADICGALLELFNVPFYREAQSFTLPVGRFQVADVCSGLSHLIIGLMIGSLAAIMLFRRWTRRAIFIAVVPVVFIVTNGVRAFIVMAVASATELKYLAGYDHVVFGWILFLLVLLGLIIVARTFSDA